MKLKKVLSVFAIGIMFFMASIALGEILFSDTFTGADGMRPPNWRVVDAPEAGFWYLQEGQFSTGNGDDLLTVGGYSYAIIDAAGSDKWSDYSIQCSFWISQRNGRIVLAARWLDKNNHYEGVLETYEGKRLIRIEKVIKGRHTSLGRVQDGINGIVIPRMENGRSPADARLMKFSVCGNKLTLSFAGTTYLEVEDSSLIQGTAGLGEWYHYAYFDDVIIQKEAVSAPARAPVSRIPTEVKPIVPPSAAPALPGMIYRITIGKSLQEHLAKNLRNQLVSWGYTPVELVKRDGGFNVYLGAFLSEAEAGTAKKFLEEEGLNPREIVALSGKKAAEVKKKAVVVRKTYRVMAKEFSNLSDAERMKNSLESNGYFPVEVADVGGEKRVYIGTFSISDEAEKLVRVLKGDGYALARVMEEVASAKPAPPSIAAAAPAPPKPLIPDMIKQRQDWRNLTLTQKQDVLSTIEKEEALRSGSALAMEIIELKERMKKLTEAQKDIVKSIREQAETEKRKQMKIAELFSRVNQARDRGKWSEALGYLDEVAKIDPNNASIELKRRTIENLSRNIKFEGQEYIEERTAKQIAMARRSAEQLMREGKYEAAIAQWNNVARLAKPGSLDSNKAKTAIGKIDGILREAKAERIRREKIRQYSIYGIGGLIIVLVVIVVSIMVKSRKRDAELLRQVQELTLKPLLELKEGRGPVAIEDRSTEAQPAAATAMGAPPMPPTAAEPVPEGEPLPPPPEPEFAPGVPEMLPETVITEPEYVPEYLEEEVPPAPVMEGEPIPESLRVEEVAQVSAEPQAPEFTTSEEETLYQSISLEDLGQIEIPIVEPELTSEEKAPDTSATAGAPIDIDELLSQGMPPAPSQPEAGVATATETPAPEAEPVAVAPSPPSPEPEPTVAETPPVIETPPPVVEAPPAPPVQPPEQVGVGNIIYEQSFDEEDTGGKPANWEGDYNYASLSVSEESPAPDSKKCMVFEKTKGAGSAFYRCHFPNTKSVMGVEFDLRCDSKNKYLLGFYIEKDEDYRYSVHTVIQYIDIGARPSQPSLRIQGKPIAYEWGTWRHIKYIINLIDGTVDGYVDGELVANQEKLISSPSSLNTISIRDNLATVGKLTIDNIRIYKA